uniref:Uncharacterized protein n=1 Tax=Glossina palpalis gambiensis TaxID=67801 RepID=A0A1B0BL87_9MUSC
MEQFFDLENRYMYSKEQRYQDFMPRNNIAIQSEAIGKQSYRKGVKVLADPIDVMNISSVAISHWEMRCIASFFRKIVSATVAVAIVMQYYYVFSATNSVRILLRTTTTESAIGLN